MDGIDIWGIFWYLALSWPLVHLTNLSYGIPFCAPLWQISAFPISLFSNLYLLYVSLWNRDMAIHAFNPSMQEAEKGGSLWVQG